MKCFEENGRALPVIIGQENQHISELLGEHYSYELGRLAVRQILTDENTPVASHQNLFVVSENKIFKFSEYFVIIKLLS